MKIHGLVDTKDTHTVGVLSNQPIFPEQSLNLHAQSVQLASVFAVFKGHKWKCPPFLASNSGLLYTGLSSSSYRQAFVVANTFRCTEKRERACAVPGCMSYQNNVKRHKDAGTAKSEKNGNNNNSNTDVVLNTNRKRGIHCR